MDEVLPLILGSPRVWILKETHFKFGSQYSSHRGINGLNIELPGVDQVGDLLEVAAAVSNRRVC